MSQEKHLLTQSIHTTLVVLFVLGGYFVNRVVLNKHAQPVAHLYHATVKLFMVTIMIVLFQIVCTKKMATSDSLLSRLSKKTFYNNIVVKFASFYRFNLGLMLIEAVFKILLNYVQTTRTVKTIRSVVFMLYITPFVIQSVWTSLDVISSITFLLYIHMIGTFVYEMITRKTISHSPQLCSYLISLINVNLLLPHLFCEK